MKRFLYEFSYTIKNDTSIDSIKKYFDKIDSTIYLFSDDSLKLKFLNNNLLKIPYTSFKNKLRQMDEPFSNINTDYNIIKNAVLADSVFNIKDSPDSLIILIDNYLDKNEQINEIISEIEKLHLYMIMYNDLLPSEEKQIIDSSQVKDSKPDPFKDLEFEDIDFNKIRLNLNK